MIVLAGILLAMIVLANCRPSAESRQLHLDGAAARATFRQPIASHRLDCRPIVTAEFRGVSVTCRLNPNTAGLSAAAVRNLKVEGVWRRLGIDLDRLAVAAHSVSPLLASKRDTLILEFGFSCGGNVARELEQL
jgi:hypothetical protein